MPANLSQNLDLVKRESPEKQKAGHCSITYEGLLQRKNDVKKCYRERVSLQEMEKPMAYDVNTILCQTKENDHFPVVVAKIEVETSNFSGAQGTGKSTSSRLVLQSLTQHDQSIEVIEVSFVSSNLSQKVRKKDLMTRYAHSSEM